MKDYLKDKQYYEDLYDLITIKKCLEVVEMFRNVYKESLTHEKVKDISQEEKLRSANYLLNWQLFSTKGERFRNRAQRINEMIQDDRKKQEFFDHTPEPKNIRCKTCNNHLTSDFKHLEDYLDEPMRVLFYFPCSTCKTKRAIYNTREELESKPTLCPKCKNEIQEKHTIKIKGKNKVITWTRTCTSCGYSEKEIDDFAKNHEEWETKKAQDKDQLEKYRTEFCLTEEQGKEYLHTIETMQYAHEVFEDEKGNYESMSLPKTKPTSKLTISELEKLVIDGLTKEGFCHLSLEKPDIGQYILVPFTIQVSNSSNSEEKVTELLNDTLTTLLDTTNWRLVKNILSFRLGYITGKLKGYENLSELNQENQLRDSRNTKPRYERNDKLESDNWVQLSRMFGKHEGIENVRKKRLETEPEGFYLDASEGPYQCGICGDYHQGNDIWWNLDGLRCRDCWRNITEGVIPALKHRYDKDREYFQDWQLISDFSIHGSTARKLKKEGILQGRDLKRSDGSSYCTVFLNSENQEFLSKYPKKPKINIEWNMQDAKGNEVKA